MATDDYIAVAADDWYQRRRGDAEGKFFRSVADQGPRKGEDGSTRQGIYCLTADGKLLAYKNAGQAPDVMREVLKQGLHEWQKVPEERRRPGAIKIANAGKVDSHYSRTPPPNGLIIKVYTRILDREKGEYRRGTCQTPGAEKAARDHLWLTEAEWKALIPTSPHVGDQVSLPAQITERILRFHLLDNTRGEPPMWQREEVRTQKIKLIVSEVSSTSVVLHLEGSALLSTDADAAKSARGFDAQLLGEIRYNRTTKAIDRFDVVAIGDYWGEGTFTPNPRAGRQPLGIAFELATGDSAADRVPPQGAKAGPEYLGSNR
jgi:hypothetical protein